MNYKQLLAGIFGLALLASFGCGSTPIPRVAVAGTTITIAVPYFFGAGFGSTMNAYFMSNPPVVPFGVPRPALEDVPYAASSGLEDEQRGEMLFALHDVDDPNSGFVTYLPVFRMLRVHMDEASAAVNPAPGETLPVLYGTDYRHGQAVAFLMIPKEVGAGSAPMDYWIFPERWRRDTADPHDFAQEQPTINGVPDSWLGWAGTGAGGGIPIRIVSAETAGTQDLHRWTPEAVWDNYAGNYAQGDAADDLDVMLPRPKIMLQVTAQRGNPAAWETSINYPRNKVEILGVEIGRRNRSGALVGWEPDEDLDPCNEEEEPGSFRVFMVDPEQKTPWVKIVYRVRPLDEDGCQGRVVAGDFAIDSPTFRSYDADGLPFGTPIWIAFGATD